MSDETVNVKMDPTRITGLVFHFNNEENLYIDMEKYVMQLEVSGIFIKEEVHKELLVLQPNPEFRTSKYIAMTSINYIEFIYEDQTDPRLVKA